jgi:hypothetical protein
MAEFMGESIHKLHVLAFETVPVAEEKFRLGRNYTAACRSFAAIPPC